MNDNVTERLESAGVTIHNLWPSSVEAQLTFFGYQRDSDGYGFSLRSQESHVGHRSVSFRRSDLNLRQPENTIVSFYRTSL